MEGEGGGSQSVGTFSYRLVVPACVAILIAGLAHLVVAIQLREGRVDSGY